MVIEIWNWLAKCRSGYNTGTLKGLLSGLIKVFCLRETDVLCSRRLLIWFRVLDCTQTSLVLWFYEINLVRYWLRVASLGLYALKAYILTDIMWVKSCFMQLSGCQQCQSFVNESLFWISSFIWVNWSKMFAKQSESISMRLHRSLIESNEVVSQSVKQTGITEMLTVRTQRINGITLKWTLGNKQLLRGNNQPSSCE